MFQHNINDFSIPIFMNSLNLQSGMRHQVFWITRRIAQGLFATNERAHYLCSQGITHILNVGESRSIITVEMFGFHDIKDFPIPDFQRIPDNLAMECLDALHAMLCEENSRVYIHCVAGQNRSPTILWLYFLACGMTPEAARTLISNHTLDAIPGHPQLVDEQLIAAVITHGKERYLPLPDSDILIPAY